MKKMPRFIGADYCHTYIVAQQSQSLQEIQMALGLLLYLQAFLLRLRLLRCDRE